jgi:hypothetical protein
MNMISEGCLLLGYERRHGQRKSTCEGNLLRELRRVSFLPAIAQ